MRYLVAPSAYKGYYSPAQIAHALAQGVHRAEPEAEVVLAPIADGGDGTVEALFTSTGGALHHLNVTGPTGQKVQATWLSLEENQVPQASESFAMVATTKRSGMLAIVELASACGLAYLLPDRLEALDANTRGAGEVLLACQENGFRDMVLAVGGSASTDGGMGILTALGGRFVDREGNTIEPSGRGLERIARAELSSLEKWQTDFRLRVATDVTNPLLGESGAARVFGPQKGASEADIAILERGLKNYADVLEDETGRLARNLPGAGAAGGVPFGLAVALNAEIIPGFRWLASMIDLESRVRDADIVITAEGKLDSQSVGTGKATGALANLCKTHQKRLMAVPALTELNVDWSAHGIAAVKASAPGAGTIASLKDVARAAEALVRQR